MLRSFIFFCLLVVVGFIFSPAPAFAQDKAGISLSPATIEDAVDPGEQFVKTLKLTNLSSEGQEYYIFTRDIEGVRDGGVPIFANEDAEVTGFEMSSWITLPEDQPLIVGPGETVSFQIKIDVPENATPGSHFAGVFSSIEAPRLRTIGAAVGYDVASVVSLRIRGDAIESATIREFSTDKTIYGSPDVNFQLRLENKGTVLLRPYGPLSITNMFGKRVELLTANESLAGVFPGTVRDFALSWTSEDLAFGKYTAEVGLVYGSEGSSRSLVSETSFWVLPMNILGPALLGILVIFLTVYFGVRLYIRSAVRRLSGQSVSRRARGRRVSNAPTSPMLLFIIIFLGVTALFLLILLILFA